MENQEGAIVRPTSNLEKIIQTVFPIVETVAPRIATNFAVNLFVRPFRFPYKAEEEEFMDACDRFRFVLNGVEHHGFKMGSGPEVICLHGWSGRSTQFRFIAPLLAEAGYTYVGFDALAHGRTEGKTATIFDFAQAFEYVLSHSSNVKAVIGHSLGAASISYAISKGAAVPAFISMGAPAVAEWILDEFVTRLNGRDRLKSAIREASRNEYNVEFDSVVMEETFKSVRCPVLAIHGKLDVDAPHENLNVLKRIRPDMDDLLIPNMGHRRILKEEPALSMVINWIKNLE